MLIILLITHKHRFSYRQWRIHRWCIWMGSIYNNLTIISTIITTITLIIQILTSILVQHRITTLLRWTLRHCSMRDQRLIWTLRIQDNSSRFYDKKAENTVIEFSEGISQISSKNDQLWTTQTFHRNLLNSIRI